MNRLTALALVAVACSRSHEREAAEQVASPPRDAPAPRPEATPAWVTAAVTHGGPGLCASIQDGAALISRRDASGRLVETLAFDARSGREPTERTSYVYDATGRLTHATRQATVHKTPDMTIDLTYDKAGRVVHKREHHLDTSFYGGDVDVKYRWDGKPLARVLGLVAPDIASEDPTDPVRYALAFSGTVYEDRLHEGLLNQYVKTFDERGRLIESRSIGYGSASGSYKLEWDARDQLVTFTTGAWVVRYLWRDGRVMEAHHTDSGKEKYVDALRYDAAGRLVEYTRVDPARTPREHLVSSQIDPDSGVLVTTTVEDTTGLLVRVTYRYDCGPAATP